MGHDGGISTCVEQSLRRLGSGQSRDAPENDCESRVRFGQTITWSTQSEHPRRWLRGRSSVPVPAQGRGKQLGVRGPRSLAPHGQRCQVSPRFEQGGFLDSPHSAPPSDYDAVLFNGSLQFFPDVSAALRRAALCLRPGGRIVLAHANGAAFVAEERRGSPTTVVSAMPLLDELEWIAREVGAQVIPPEQLGWRDPTGLDGFYLAALELGPA